MIRGGSQSQRRYGTDSFLSTRGAKRKVVLEFDLGGLRPNFPYAFTLQLYITYVAAAVQRSVLVSYVNDTDFEWDESSVTWDNFGLPETQEIGWFSIFNSDRDTLLEIPMGELPTAGGRLILILRNIGAEGTDMGDSKFDFRSREFGSAFPEEADAFPPTLIGVPQLHGQGEVP